MKNKEAIWNLDERYICSVIQILSRRTQYVEGRNCFWMSLALFQEGKNSRRVPCCKGSCFFNEILKPHSWKEDQFLYEKPFSDKFGKYVFSPRKQSRQDLHKSRHIILLRRISRALLTFTLTSTNYNTWRTC